MFWVAVAVVVVDIIRGSDRWYSIELMRGSNRFKMIVDDELR